MRTSSTLLTLALLFFVSTALRAEPLVVVEAVAVEEEKLGLGDFMEGKPAAEQDDADKIRERQSTMIRQSLLPMAAFELSFLKRTCDPSEEQLKKAETIARDQLDKYSTNWKEQGNKDEQRQIAFAINNGARIQAQAIQPAAIAKIVSNLYDPMTNSLRSEFEGLLDESQQTAYQKELKTRDEYEQKAIIDFLLVILDDKLNLTEKQSEKIADGMRARWGEGWVPPLSLMANFGEYFPPIPDAAIIPHLETGQIDVWRSARIVRFSSYNQHKNSFFPNEFDLDQPAPATGSEK